MYRGRLSSHLAYEQGLTYLLVASDILFARRSWMREEESDGISLVLYLVKDYLLENMNIDWIYW